MLSELCCVLVNALMSQHKTTKGCPQWLMHTVNCCSFTGDSKTGHKIGRSKCLWTPKTTAVVNKMKFPASIHCLKTFCTVYMLYHRCCFSGVCAWRIDQYFRKCQFDSWCKSYCCNKLGRTQQRLPKLKTPLHHCNQRPVRFQYTT